MIVVVETQSEMEEYKQKDEKPGEPWAHRHAFFV
jgi:hypothetical protein